MHRRLGMTVQVAVSRLLDVLDTSDRVGRFCGQMVKHCQYISFIFATLIEIKRKCPSLIPTTLGLLRYRKHIRDASDIPSQITTIKLNL